MVILDRLVVSWGDLGASWDALGGVLGFLVDFWRPPGSARRFEETAVPVSGDPPPSPN